MRTQNDRNIFFKRGNYKGYGDAFVTEKMKTALDLCLRKTDMGQGTLIVVSSTA